ncbi:TetR/AcrR family transcriptional regulator [Gordonia sp. (in: high G+C Gram-positive bacteria)]|uniref:TetR/AcrR family transcriptional regulator n=1 Tax=unclassified Gordonia (in: high G+C Gram-positive bacteria) TaxID=2657482 RepID=UPI00260EF1B8|nr:TetR/AcrR family transcriptional regulator [Gordonia sp. (in: high G+C Gram-positive bacteria)]
MTSESAPTTRPGGRTERTRRAVLAAAATLLAKSPPSEVTVAQIAEKAGVNEATVYRKWGTKDALYGDVLMTLSRERLVMDDTGSLRGDLLAVIGGVAAFLRTPAGFSLAYLGATGDDATTATLRDTFWADRFARAREIFDRAVARGELRDAAQADLAYEMLIGVMHFRILALRRPLDDDIADRIVTLVLDGLRPR